MKITDKKVVALTYELKVNGEVVDKATEERPLEFIQGMGYLLPLFEKNVEGKEPGDGFAFTLEARDGYGEWQLEKVLDLPKEAFAVDGTIREDLLFVGNVIPLMNPMGGVIPGKVLEVGDKTVKMDLNHPMAGKTLNFTGKVVSVREATEKELAEGLHGEAAGHCGGDCGHCKSDCDGQHEEGKCKKGGCGGHHEGGKCKKGGCKKENKE